MEQVLFKKIFHTKIFGQYLSSTELLSGLHVVQDQMHQQFSTVLELNAHPFLQKLLLLFSMYLGVIV
jgi:hypothetical protein